MGLYHNTLFLQLLPHLFHICPQGIDTQHRGSRLVVRLQQQTGLFDPKLFQIQLRQPPWMAVAQGIIFPLGLTVRLRQMIFIPRNGTQYTVDISRRLTVSMAQRPNKPDSLIDRSRIRNAVHPKQLIHAHPQQIQYAGLYLFQSCF